MVFRFVIVNSGILCQIDYQNLIHFRSFVYFQKYNTKMKLNLFLISFLIEYIVFCTCQENTISTTIADATTTESGTLLSTEIEHTSEAPSTDSINNNNGSTSSEPSSPSSVISGLSLTTSTSTVLPSSPDDVSNNHSTVSQVTISTSSAIPDLGYVTGSTIVGAEVELDTRDNRSLNQSHSEISQNTSPLISSTNTPVTEIVTEISQSSSIGSQAEAVSQATVSNSPTTDTSHQINLNENISQSTTTITENYPSSSISLTPDVETATSSQTITPVTQTQEASQITWDQNISERARSSSSSTTQDTTTGDSRTITFHLSEESTTHIQTNASTTERSTEHHQNVTTSTSTVETSRDSSSSTARTEIQSSTSFNDSNLNTNSESITYITETTSLPSQIQTIVSGSEAANSSTTDNLDNIQYNLTTGNQSSLNTTTESYEVESTEQKKYISNTTTETADYDSSIKEGETIKYCKQSDIIFALIVMFSLHILSLTIAMIFIFHKMRKGRSWERPIMRYRASGVLNNNGSSPAQVECIGAVSGLNLASDSECKRGENETDSTPTINIKDGWCTPLEKNEEKKNTEDTGV